MICFRSGLELRKVKFRMSGVGFRGLGFSSEQCDWKDVAGLGFGRNPLPGRLELQDARIETVSLRVPYSISTTVPQTQVYLFRPPTLKRTLTGRLDSFLRTLTRTY